MDPYAHELLLLVQARLSGTFPSAENAMRLAGRGLIKSPIRSIIRWRVSYPARRDMQVVDTSNVLTRPLRR